VNPVPEFPEPLSPTASYFEVLGVPVAATDAELTRRFHELSRRYHPDRWATADAATQAIALDSAALLNDAYRTLKDPFARAQYLLRRERSEGIGPDDTRNSAQAPPPPQALFAQVLELQEALMEFQEARLEDDQAVLERLRPALVQARETFEAAYNSLRERLGDLFVRWDAGTDRTAVLENIAEVIGTRGYLRRVLTNLDAALA
jgi:molecular chaperone HscB